MATGACSLTLQLWPWNGRLHTHGVKAGCNQSRSIVFMSRTSAVSTQPCPNNHPSWYMLHVQTLCAGMTSQSGQQRVTWPRLMAC